MGKTTQNWNKYKSTYFLFSFFISCIIMYLFKIVDFVIYKFFFISFFTLNLIFDNLKLHCMSLQNFYLSIFFICFLFYLLSIQYTNISCIYRTNNMHMNIWYNCTLHHMRIAHPPTYVGKIIISWLKKKNIKLFSN